MLIRLAEGEQEVASRVDCCCRWQRDVGARFVGARHSSEKQAITPARYDEGMFATNHNAAAGERGYHNITQIVHSRRFPPPLSTTVRAFLRFHRATTLAISFLVDSRRVSPTIYQVATTHATIRALSGRFLFLFLEIKFCFIRWDLKARNQSTLPTEY